MSLFRYRPTVPVTFIQKELSFANTDECNEFLSQFEITYASDSQIDCKASQNVILQTPNSWNPIIITIIDLI